MNESEFRSSYSADQLKITASEELKNKTLDFVMEQSCVKTGNTVGAKKDASHRSAPVCRQQVKKEKALFTQKRWWGAAAACIVTVALLFGIPFMVPGGGSDTLGSAGFAVRAYASTTDSMLSLGDDGKIIFDRDSASGSSDWMYAQEGSYTGCLFKVEGEGITRIQASLSSGEFYRFTSDVFTKSDAPDKWAEALSWKGTNRGQGEYYALYDQVKPMGVYDGTDRADADHLCKVNLSKRLGPTIDIPIEAGNSGDYCFGLWTNAPLKDQGEEFKNDSVIDKAIDTFEGTKLTVTVQFEDGRFSTQVIELHAADIKAELAEQPVENAPEGTTATENTLLLVPEIVDRNNLQGNEIFLHSLYGEVAESNNEAFPGSLDNANEYETTVSPALVFPRQELMHDSGDRVIADTAIKSPAESITVKKSDSDFGDQAYDLHIDSLVKSKYLPDGVTVADTDISYDPAYLNQSSEQVFGYRIADDGSLNEGFSYLIATMSLTNASDQPVTTRVGSLGSYGYVSDGEGHYETSAIGIPIYYTGLPEMLRGEFRGLQLAAHETKTVTYVMIVPDELAQNKDLLFIVPTAFDYSTLGAFAVGELL